MCHGPPHPRRQGLWRPQLSVPVQGLDQRPGPSYHQGHPPRHAPARRHRTRHRPPQGGSPHAPQLSHRPRWRSHQRRARRCRLQLQPAPALVRGAFTCPLVDPLARPLGRLASPNPVPQNFLHGRLTTEATKALATITAWVTAINDSFSNFQAVMLLQRDVDAINAFNVLVKSHATLAKSEGEALELSTQEKRLVETIGLVRDLERQFDQYQENTAIVRAFEKQILALTTIFDRFVPVQNAAIQAVLDKISKDVGTYYTALHPKENVDKVRLSVVGEEGIEFEYQFHGR